MQNWILQPKKKKRIHENNQHITFDAMRNSSVYIPFNFLKIGTGEKNRLMWLLTNESEQEHRMELIWLFVRTVSPQCIICGARV